MSFERIKKRFDKSLSRLHLLNPPEIWIEGLEGRYSVSPEGKVYSYLRGRREMSGGLVSNNGKDHYKVFTVSYDDYVTTNIYVHRAVANAFLRGEDISGVRHKDGNKLNNNINNLEYI